MLKERPLPKSVAAFVHQFDGWIIGSYADPDIDPSSCKDIDVVIPYANWQAAAALIPDDAEINCYGGWKYIENEHCIDVWPDDIGNCMRSAMMKFLWQPRYELLFVKTII